MATQQFRLLGSPIRVPLSGAYTISVDGTEVYNGYIAQMPGQSAMPEVDIAPILRQVIAVPAWETAMQSIAGVVDIPSLVIPVIVSHGMGTITFNVVWDYTARTYRWSGFMPFWGGVQRTIYPTQRLGFYLHTSLTNTNLHPTGQNSPAIQIYYGDFLGTNRLVAFLANLKVLLSDYPPNASSYFWGYQCLMNGSESVRDGDYHLPISDCVPRGTMTLYFVRPDGSFGWVHLTCKNKASINISRSQITHESKIDAPASFGIDNYNIATYKSYTLNTDYLTEAQSARLQDLFVSPKVWLQDYADDSIRSVVLTDNSVEVKTKATHGTLLNYTIKCRESQTYNIKP